MDVGDYRHPFKYTTSRRVVIHSRLLGILHITGILAVLGFFFIKRIYVERRHLDKTALQGTVHYFLGPPDRESLKTYSDLYYCMDFHEKRETRINPNSTLEASHRLPCVNVPATYLNSLARFDAFVATSLHDTVHYDEDCLQGPEYYNKVDAKTSCVVAGGIRQHYIANVEQFKFYLRHEVLEETGEPIDQSTIHGKGAVCADGTTIPIRQDPKDPRYDMFLVNDILRCAGVDLGRHSNIHSEPLRKRGVDLRLSIEYSHGFWGDVEKYSYYFSIISHSASFVAADAHRPKAFQNAWGRRRRRREAPIQTAEQNGTATDILDALNVSTSKNRIHRRGILDAWNAPTCARWCKDTAEQSSWDDYCFTKDCSGCPQCDFDMHPLSVNQFENVAGIRIHVIQNGYKGSFSLAELLVSWSSTMALLGFLKKAIDFILIFVLPLRDLYREYKFVHSVDIQAFEGGEIHAVEGVNEMLKANATFQGRRHCKRYQHHLDDSISRKSTFQTHIHHPTINIDKMQTTGVDLDKLCGTAVDPCGDVAAGSSTQLQHGEPIEDVQDVGATCAQGPSFGPQEIPQYSTAYLELGKELEALRDRFDSDLNVIRAGLAELRASQWHLQKQNPEGTLEFNLEANVSSISQINSMALEDRLFQPETSRQAALLEARDISGKRSVAPASPTTILESLANLDERILKLEGTDGQIHKSVMEESLRGIHTVLRHCDSKAELNARIQRLEMLIGHMYDTADDQRHDLAFNVVLDSDKDYLGVVQDRHEPIGDRRHLHEAEIGGAREARSSAEEEVDKLGGEAENNIRYFQEQLCEAEPSKKEESTQFSKFRKDIFDVWNDVFAKKHSRVRVRTEKRQWKETEERV